MTVTVTPMSHACGAEISGIDLRKSLADDDILAIRQAWLDHLVIVFRGQDLTPADQKRACGHFGEIGCDARAELKHLLALLFPYVGKMRQQL